MKKSLKIFVLAASLLQAALFSAFAANPPSDFKYELINNNKAVKITGVRNDKAEYVVPASIEDFPVTEVELDKLSKPCNISIPEGCVRVYISLGNDDSVVTVSQLPSTVKDFQIAGRHCKYNGTLPVGIEEFSIIGSGKDIKLNQNFSELKDLRNFSIKGDENDHINLTLDLSQLQNLDSFSLFNVDVTSKTPLPPLKATWLDTVNFIDNKTFYINVNPGRNTNIVRNTNVEELIIEEGVTKIGRFSVENNKNLKKIVLPSTLKYVESEIFTDCPNLSEVVVPDSLGKVVITTKVRYENGYRKPENIADIFDTTSLPLKTQARLNEIFFPEN